MSIRSVENGEISISLIFLGRNAADIIYNKSCLIVCILKLPETYLFAFAAIRPQCFFFSSGIIFYHSIGRIQDILRRPVVLLKFDNKRVRIDTFEIQDISYVCPSESVDRLVIITYNTEIPVSVRQKSYKFELGSVRVLIFIDHNISESFLIRSQHFTICFKQFNGLYKKIIEIHSIILLQFILILKVCPCYSLFFVVTSCSCRIPFRSYQFIFSGRYRVEYRLFLELLSIYIKFLADLLHKRLLIIRIIYHKMIIISDSVCVPAKNSDTR